MIDPIHHEWLVANRVAGHYEVAMVYAIKNRRTDRPAAYRAIAAYRVAQAAYKAVYARFSASFRKQKP